MPSERNRQFIETQFGLATTAQAAGRIDDAIIHYRAALALDPDLPEAHNNLGVALENSGRLDEALGHYRAAVVCRPGYAEAYVNLGNALAGQGKGGEAVAAYRRAIEIDPSRPEAHYNLGNCLYVLRKLTEAAAAFRRAIELRPDHAEAHNNLGIVLQELYRTREAVAAYRQALALRPDMAEAHANLGNVLVELGEFDAAMAEFLRSIEYAPGQPNFYFNLSNLRTFAPGDAHLAAMESLARDLASLPPDQAIALLFALAKAYGDIGEHERAFRHLAEGNLRKRRGIAYDEAATLGSFDRIRKTFSRELLAKRRDAGDPSPKPVFIVGMPRSGTTLVEQILASHPSVFGAGELYDLDDIVTELGNDAFPEAAARLPDAELRALGARYVARLPSEAGAAKRVTDKMTWNFRYVGLIRLILPNARIVHMRRDPVDTCMSCFARLFAREQAHTYDLAELGRYYRAYRTLMAHWREVLPAGVMLELDYESVVADLEGSARRLLAHLGLPWDEACLSFHATRRPVRTSSAVQVRQPIYRSAVGRWAPYLPYVGTLTATLDETAAKAGAAR